MLWRKYSGTINSLPLLTLNHEIGSLVTIRSICAPQRKKSWIKIGIKRVLDFGTGTGILAIATIKLGAASVVALDYDEWSILNANENVKRNHVQRKISSCHGELRNVSAQKFDLIVGNVDFITISKSLPRLLRLIHPAGILILSGFLTSDLNSFLDSMRERGAFPLEIIDENEWVALALTKIRASQLN